MDGLIEIFLFCGVLCYFFNLRPNTMLDVLSTRLREIYTKWETKTDIKTVNEEPTGGTPYSFNELKRIGQKFQRKKIHEREYSKKIRESSLFKIKESEPLESTLKEKPLFLQYCCNNCTPASRGSLVNIVKQQQQPFGSNVLVVKPGNTILSNPFCYLFHVARFKRYNYPMVTQTIWNNEKLKEAIKVITTKELPYNGYSEKRTLEDIKNIAKDILLQMESRCSDVLLKIVAWLIYKLLPNFIQSAIVLPPQIEMLKKANDTGLPLIFLPLHRSHLDYTMISFIMVTNGIKNPLIAAGNNLKIPFFGWLLRGLGAFFIKRRIDPITGRKDVLYRNVLQAYIMENLRIGHNMEFFMEGGRTRTGKPCIPKSGILSVIVDAYMDGIIEDALLVPIAMNYERLVDGNFVREQLGQPKKMETFKSTIKAMWSIFRGHYGMVKIDFCQPFSLREMVKTFQAPRNKLSEKSSFERPLTNAMSNSSLYGTDVVLEEYRQLVDNIARHVVYDSSKSTPIMSTNIVACLFLNKFRNGCSLNMLMNEFNLVRRSLEYSDKNIAFCGENIDIITHALDILGPNLIKKHEITHVANDKIIKSIIFAPILSPSSLIELSYYSNTMLLHYVMESVIVNALYAEFQSIGNPIIKDADRTFIVHQNLLVERALKLCDILRYEFIFCRPCQELTDIILETIQNLLHTGIFNSQEEACLEEEIWSKRYARNFDDSSDEEYSRKQEIEKIQYKVNIPEQWERLEFFYSFLQPLINTYSCSAWNLRKLVGRMLTEEELLKDTLKEMKHYLAINTLHYGESICVDPLKNSFRLFEKWNILDFYIKDHRKIFFLKEQYDSDVEMTNLFRVIGVYR